MPLSESTSVLAGLGWGSPFAEELAELGDAQLVPGRIVLQQRGRYTIATESGEIAAELTAKLRKDALSAAALPCVGDWVAVRLPAPATESDLAAICALLPRKTKFSRRAAGAENCEQILAANVDFIFIAMGLNGDFNLRRLERYLTVAWSSGGQPIVLLTKSDLCTQVEVATRVEAVQAIAPAVPVVTISVITEAGVHAVDPFLASGKTIALLGSSGVGKSTLVNALLERNVLRVGEVRAADGRGRHTTTQRQLFRVRGGALVIDTPGIRELQLWDAAVGFESTFGDIEAVGSRCRFRDCRHGDEPGCAVVEAVALGQLAAARVASFSKLLREQTAVATRGDPALAKRQKRAHASVTKLVRRKHQED